MKTITILVVINKYVSNNITFFQSCVIEDPTTPNNGFTDPRDGQTYTTVNIVTQTWFAENLNYQTTNSWWYDNNSENSDVYGKLYTWDITLIACPNGWHLPRDEE